MSAIPPEHSGISKREVTESENSQQLKRARLEQEALPSSDVAHAQPDDAEKVAAARRGAKTSGKKNAGRRRRGTRPQADEGAEDAGSSIEKAPRLPKRLCALLIGFCGSGFNGMQIQPDVRTIEGVLFEALVDAGAVSQDNADDPVKVGLQRAARTDTGVHAAGNVVSLKMITGVPGVPDLVSRINASLPPEIRLWDFIRVQNSFNARMSCDSRKYTYFFPSYLLIPPKPGSGLYRSTSSEPSSSATASSLEADVPTHPFWAETKAKTSREQDMLRKKKWRVGPEPVAALRAAAQRFEGTHNFHNFTVGRDPKDRSCHRFMKSIEISDPVVYSDTEWISVMLHGQSFMLHQVNWYIDERKMVCVLVMAVRTGTPASIIDELYAPRIVVVPKMPSLGLLLEHPIFESYSRKVTDLNKKLQPTHPDYRPPISFDAHKEAMQKFKEEHIYSRMRTSEERVEVFDRWVTSFDKYIGPDLLYYNARGVIPDAAVMQKGQKRALSFKEKRKFDATEFSTDGPLATFADDEEAEADIEEEQEEEISKKELEEAEG